MLDAIKKGLLAGVGLAAMTKDKIEELVKEIIERGEMSEREGKELIDKLLEKSEQARKELEKKVEDMVHKALEKVHLATKKDVAGLEERIKDLEQKGAKEAKTDVS